MNSTHNGPFQIRLAAAEDAAAIAAVLYESFVEYQSAYTAEAFAATTPTTAEILARLGEGPVWVAVQGGVIVGTASAVLQDGGVYIRSVAVHPAARGQKIGELLLGYIEGFATANNRDRLFLCTTPFLDRAIRLYEHLGFVRKNGEANELLGTPLFSMERILRSSG